jgi:LuxR family maltose regulon positive regulatory protein
VAKNGLLKTAWTELFLAQQQFGKAEAILTQPGRTSIHTSSLDVLPYSNLLLAMAYWGQSKYVQARQEMMSAIRMAEPESIIRPFLDCGDRIIPLLTDVLHMRKLGILHRQFVNRLMDQFRAAYPALALPPAEEMAVPLWSQLTPREREILKLLDEGLDNKALARRLVVADSTVRTHLRNVYRKLEVSSRSQAIHRAREARLL